MRSKFDYCYYNEPLSFGKNSTHVLLIEAPARLAARWVSQLWKLPNSTTMFAGTPLSNVSVVDRNKIKVCVLHSVNNTGSARLKLSRARTTPKKMERKTVENQKAKEA